MSVSPTKDSNILYYNFHLDTDPESSEKKTFTEGEKAPLLFVDVNLGGEAAERIIVFEGDTAIDLA